MSAYENRASRRPCSWRGLALRRLALPALALGFLPHAGWAAEAPGLRAGIRITGRVELPAGAAPEARATARVELVSALESYDAAKRELAGAPPPPPLAAAHPDRQGVFTLLAPGPGCYRVEVRAEGFLAVEHLLLPLVEDAELPPIRLEPVAPVSVRVLGPDGKPLARLQLSAAAESGAWWEGQEPPAWRPIERAGRTGVDGRLAFPRAAGESLRVQVVDLRSLGAAVSVPEAAAGARRTEEPTLRLARRPSLVLEAHDPAGKPVAGALLRWGDGRPAAIAGADGRFPVSFDDPRSAGPEGAVTLASPGGDLLGEVDWRRVRGGLLRVALAPVRELSGQLADRATGAAVGGGLVWIERTGWRGALGVAAVATAGADGRFRLRARTADNLRPRAAARGYLTVRADDPSSGSGGYGPWRIALDRAASLDGVVVDAAGHGVAGAAIGFRPRLPVPAGPPRALSGPDGRFRLPDVVAGERYELAISAPGFAPASASVRVTRPEPGKPAAPVRIVLAAGRSLAGTVVNEAGLPLAGVAVTLLPAEDLPVALWKRHLARRAQDMGAQEVQTDASGAFEIPHLAAGRYGLAAHGPGLAITLRDGIGLAAGEGPLDLGRIVVERGAAIAGRIVDRRGVPVAEAIVRYTPSPKGLPSPIGTSGLLGGSDVLDLGGGGEVVPAGPDGRFEISGLRRGEAFDLRIIAEGHPGATRQGVRAPTEEPLAIELEDGGRVSGRVVDGQGRPVFGALVSGKGAGERGGGLEVWAGRGTAAATDASGEFSLVGLPAGAVDLAVEAPGYRAARRRDVEVAAGRETAGVEIVLDAGSVLSGHVRDAVGKPVPRAGVTAQRDFAAFDVLALMTGEQTMSLAQARTDADGAYRLEGLETGRYQVNAGYARQGARATIDVQPGENTLDLTTEASTYVEVSGRVLDASGAPVAGASLSLTAEASPGLYRASSLADGSFAFGTVAPGEYRLTVEARGYATATNPEPVVVGDDAVDGLEITLAKVAGSIRGKLTGLAPAELLRVQVTAIPFGPGRTIDPRTVESAVVGTVDASGSYRIDDLAPGAWSVTALADSGRRASGMLTLELEGPEGRLDLDLSGGATLSGRVTLDGRSVAGAQVVVGVEDRSKVPAQSDTAADGSFRIPGLEPATYVFMVIDPRTFSHSFSTLVVEGDREVDVELGTGSIRGRVLDAAGAPVEGAQVAVEGIDPPRPFDLGMGQQAVASRADGGFEIPSLVAGRYRVKASREGLAPGQATVDIAPQATAQVEIRLGKAP